MTKKEPAVSVVISTYKRAHLVGRAVRSALGQTIRDVEVIVVDDCSPDNTGDVVSALIEADDRVRYIRHDRNMGLPAGRNSGIRAATAPFVAFLDDDDEWVENKLARQLVAIGGAEAVLTGALINGCESKCHGKPRITTVDLRKGNEFDPSSLMVRTEVLRALWFDESLRVGEDWDIFIRLAQRANIAYVNEPLLLYSDGDHPRMTSESKRLSNEQIEARMGVLIKHRDFFGPFWFEYHRARFLLSYFQSRKEKLRQLRYVLRRCGVVPVLFVFCSKLRDQLRRARSGRNWRAPTTAVRQ